MTSSSTDQQWSAVIINYNAGALLTKCVASVLADSSAGMPFVVIVDNGSIDSSIADVRAQFPDICIMETGENLGYAKAANRGIAHTTTPIVAVLNPDLEMDPGTAAAMLSVFDERSDVGAVGPKICNLDGTVYPSARFATGLGTAIGHATLSSIAPRNRWTRRYRGDGLYAQGRREVDWISGAAIWLRRSAVDEIGGWDEQFFMYVEDVDVCWRLQRAGYAITYEPAGSVTHVQGAITRRRPYRMILEHHRSWWRFTRKRWTGWRAVLLPLAAVFLILRAGAACAIRALRGAAPGRSPRRQVAG